MWTLTGEPASPSLCSHHRHLMSDFPLLLPEPCMDSQTIAHPTWSSTFKSPFALHCLRNTVPPRLSSIWFTLQQKRLYPQSMSSSWWPVILLVWGLPFYLREHHPSSPSLPSKILIESLLRVTWSQKSPHVFSQDAPLLVSVVLVHVF